MDIGHKYKIHKILKRYANSPIYLANKTCRKKLKKIAILLIVMLVYKLEKVKDIFKNGKPFLNLNSMRLEKGRKLLQLRSQIPQIKI